MPTDEPIGHLDFDPQQCRDAAAGPPEPCSPGTEKWPAVLVEPRRAGTGGYWPDGMRFHCTCGEDLSSVGRLIYHTVVEHHRPPHDAERVPLAAVKRAT